jgi:hypothetical protein
MRRLDEMQRAETGTRVVAMKGEVRLPASLL